MDDGEFTIDGAGRWFVKDDGFDTCRRCCCPTVCDECGDKTLTLSGFTVGFYTRLNGLSFPMTLRFGPFACSWVGSLTVGDDNHEASIFCLDGRWYVQVLSGLMVDGALVGVTLLGSIELAPCPDGAYGVNVTNNTNGDTDTGVATVA